LWSAAEKGDLGAVKGMCKKWGGRMDVINWANPEEVADLWGQSFTGTTSLFAASFNGRTDVVKVLVSLPGIDINKADRYAYTPIGVAKNDAIRAILRAKRAK
jgi:ankyrin repeat protein